MGKITSERCSSRGIHRLPPTTQRLKLNNVKKYTAHVKNACNPSFPIEINEIPAFQSKKKEKTGKRNQTRIGLGESLKFQLSQSNHCELILEIPAFQSKKNQKVAKSNQPGQQVIMPSKICFFTSAQVREIHRVHQMQKVSRSQLASSPKSRSEHRKLRW